jgi:hypothetical protein
MTETHVVGERVRLKDSYDWAGGKYAGVVVRIAVVQDDRAVLDDDYPLIYEAEFVNDHGEVCAVGIPVLPADIDESYDHYEVERAKAWNGFLGSVTS